jgi:hypothetical protein
MMLIYSYIATKRAIDGEAGFMRNGKPDAAAVEKWLCEMDHVAHQAGGSSVQVVPALLHGALSMDPGAKISPQEAIPNTVDLRAKDDFRATIERELLRLGGLEPVGQLGFVPVTAGEIAALRDQLLVTLPPEFEWFATRFGLTRLVNMARMRYLPYASAHSSGGETYLSVFYGGERDDSPFWRSLVGNRRQYLGRIPDMLTPIGRDSFGNQICIGIGGQEYGKIFFWEHENEIEFDDSREEDGTIPRDILFARVSLVADSFVDFLRQLTPEPAAPSRWRSLKLPFRR